jgi:hypothetical protein
MRITDGDAVAVNLTPTDGMGQLRQRHLPIHSGARFGRVAAAEGQRTVPSWHVIGVTQQRHLAPEHDVDLLLADEPERLERETLPPDQTVRPRIPSKAVHRDVAPERAAPGTLAMVT